MKRLVPVPIAIFALVATVAAQSDLRKHFRSIYREFNDAIRTKQVDRAERLIERYGHPDFVYIRSNGQRLDRRAMFAEMKVSLGPQTKVLKSVSRVVSVAVKGAAATVATEGEYEIQMPYTDGKLHLFAGASRSLDTWVKTPSGWKLKEVRIVSDKTTMDGKPLKM